MWYIAITNETGPKSLVIKGFKACFTHCKVPKSGYREIQREFPDLLCNPAPSGKSLAQLAVKRRIETQQKEQQKEELHGNLKKLLDAMEHPEKISEEKKKSVIENGKIAFGDGVFVTFDGEEMSTNTGILLVKKFCESMRFEDIIRQNLAMPDNRRNPEHSFSEIIMQIVYMLISGYCNDNSVTEIINDPAVQLHYFAITNHIIIQ